MTVHSKSLVGRLVTAFTLKAKSPGYPERKSESNTPKRKRKAFERATPAAIPSIFSQLKNGVGNNVFELEILIESLTLLADILYISTVDLVPIPNSEIEDLINRLNNQIQLLVDMAFDIKLDPWKVVICTKVRAQSNQLLSLYQKVLSAEPIRLSDIHALTSQYGSKRSLTDETQRRPWSSPAITELFSTPRHVDYIIPCWRSGCRRVLRQSELSSSNKNFFYCQRWVGVTLSAFCQTDICRRFPRCYIASYCSEFCALHHWNSRHRNVIGIATTYDLLILPCRLLYRIAHTFLVLRHSRASSY